MIGLSGSCSNFIAEVSITSDPEESRYFLSEYKCDMMIFFFHEKSKIETYLNLNSCVKNDAMKTALDA